MITPLVWQQWERELEDHPDKEWVQFLVRGIRQGFRVGHDQSVRELRRCSGNMCSAREQRAVIQEYLDEEVEAGRVWRVRPEDVAKVHCSPFGVIPKKGKPGRWRLIVDLSTPNGGSVNEGVCKEWSSLHYMSVDHVVEQVLKVGRGAELAKADVKKAYRNVPVHPDDRWLLGMEWQGTTFVDGTLPFGLRSAPLLFTALGDALEWVAKAHGAGWLRHYIDDFVTVGAPGTGECARSLRAFKEVCGRLGMPLDDGKEEGPAVVLTFLGMELDTQQGEVRLPRERLLGLRKKLEEWRGMKSCRKQELLSVMGHLSHACRAVRAGRSFMRRLLDLSATVRSLDRRVRLNVAARADLEWWHRFGLHWNGTAMMRSVVAAEEPQVELWTDASGSWGCSAIWGTRWFQLSWERLPAAGQWNIMPKELLPIVVATAVWGHLWRGMTVLFHCDNMAVVATLRSGSCREPQAMHLRRCLAFMEATGEFVLLAEHVRGVDNVAADELSRGRLMSARIAMQVSDGEQQVVPDRVLELMVTGSENWSDRQWLDLQRFTSEKA